MIFQVGGIIFGIGLLLGVITSIYGRIYAKGFFGFPEGKRLTVYNKGLLATVVLAALGGGLMVVGKFWIH